MNATDLLMSILLFVNLFNGITIGYRLATDWSWLDAPLRVVGSIVVGLSAGLVAVCTWWFLS